MVTTGAIEPLCGMLNVPDSRMVGVTLEGLDNILRIGKSNAVDGVNPYVSLIEEAYGKCCKDEVL